MKAVIGILIAVAVIAGGYYYFAGSPAAPEADERNAMEEGEAMTDDGAAMEEDGAMMDDGEAMEEGGAMMEDDHGAVKEFTVEGGSYYFSPSTLRVKQGDTVRVTFTNAGGVHDFVIDEFDVATERTNGGEAVTVEFVADQVGTFDYYCSVGNHREQGMEGVLTVAE